MSASFFGGFLVDRGVVTAEQLAEAVQAQHEHNVLLGVLCLREGFLKQAQVEELLHAQHRLNRRFGQIARERGYLSDDQLRELLRVQSENHLYLGQALLRKGYLTEASLRRCLDDFESFSRATEQQVERKLQDAADADFLPTVLETTRVFLYRLGYQTRVELVQDSQPAREDRAVVSATQHLAGGGDRHFALLLSDELMSLLAGARTLPRAHVPDLSREATYEVVSEMFYNLNYVICAELRKAGHKIRHGAVHSELPESGSLTAVLLSTIADSFWLLYARG